MMGVNSCMMGCMMRGRGGVMRSNNCMMCCMVRSSDCMMGCMVWSGNCMMRCRVRSHSMRQLSMSGVTGLDDLRRRPDLSRWLAPRV